MTFFQAHPGRRVMCGDVIITNIAQRTRWAWKSALRVQYHGLSLRTALLTMHRIACETCAIEKP